MIALWGPPALYALAIFIESSISRVPAFPSGFSDKDAHALLYAGLAGLVIRALCGARWSRVSVGAGAMAIGLAAAYGATDEFHQWFVPGRTADPADWVADVVGAAIGVGLVLLAARLVTARANGGARGNR